MFAPTLKALNELKKVDKEDTLREKLQELIDNIDKQYQEIKKKRNTYQKSKYTPIVEKKERKPYKRKPREELKTNNILEYHKNYYRQHKLQEQEQ